MVKKTPSADIEQIKNKLQHYKARALLYQLPEWKPKQQEANAII
jgi:hypothetical protein